MLTFQQARLLEFIADYTAEKAGVSPSFVEMQAALGLGSKSNIHRLLSGLEERGFIQRLAHRARSIEVLKLPTDSRPAPTFPARHHFCSACGQSLPRDSKSISGSPVETAGDSGSEC